MAESAPDAERPAVGAPSEVTSFVGRRRELAEARRLLSAARVVTLTGVGGVGKTRLAMRLADEVRRAFPAGVWLVDLTAVEAPELLVHAVGEALEIQDRSARPALQVLVENLRGKQALLLLDNCEHLISECAELADRLVQHLPDLRILATSRQTLGIAGEHVLHVPTLPRDEAVQLFAERAQTMLRGFTLTGADRRSVELICARLDGIPLAIELASARLRVLSPAQVLARLDDSFGLLTTGSRTALPRRRTLREMIGWSHALCTKQEQLLWARASVFADSIELEAAEEVCSGDGIALEEVIDVVTGLVDKSILIREEHAHRVRYRLLETIKQYGRERLRELGQEEELRRRHRGWFHRLVARAEPEWFGPGQAEWFARLRAEQGNIRVALNFCVTERHEARRGLRMAAALCYYWIATSSLREGRRWLDLLLSLDTAPTAVRAKALIVNARLAILQSDFASAGPVLRDGRALAGRLGDARTLAMSMHVEGLAALIDQDLPRAVILLGKSCKQYEHLGDRMSAAISQMYLATAQSYLGDHDQAAALFDDCVAVCDAHGELWFKSYALCVSGIAAWRVGDASGAYALELESIRLKRPFNDRLGLAMCVEVMAWIAAEQGENERAARLLGAVVNLWRSIGGPLFGYLTDHHARCEEAVRRALPARTFDDAVHKGTALSLAALIELARREDAAAPEVAEPSPLTRREAEIAELVARGMSNKEIAAALVIAQRTAEGHVEHILAKLGFKSRAQIAVWVSERSRA
ncbi:ATP-binding protein [Nonomuraea sp. NPDC049269]|uniref:ATP-binding protein n=1 Tax=Nonomuraea sp. NPDC049269 TaxID=3364349 RepID=UPI003723DA23